jgi:hypothetical protein
MLTLGPVGENKNMRYVYQTCFVHLGHFPKESTQLLCVAMAP